MRFLPIRDIVQHTPHVTRCNNMKRELPPPHTHTSLGTLPDDSVAGEDVDGPYTAEAAADLGQVGGLGVHTREPGADTRCRRITQPRGAPPFQVVVGVLPTRACLPRRRSSNVTSFLPTRMFAIAFLRPSFSTALGLISWCTF